MLLRRYDSSTVFFHGKGVWHAWHMILPARVSVHGEVQEPRAADAEVFLFECCSVVLLTILET